MKFWLLTVSVAFLLAGPSVAWAGDLYRQLDDGLKVDYFQEMEYRQEDLNRRLRQLEDRARQLGASLEAERKMGEMLLATERAKGLLKRGPVVTSSNHGEPTLSDLGVTKYSLS